MSELKEVFDDFAKRFSGEIHGTVDQVGNEIFYKPAYSQSDKEIQICEVAEFAIQFFETMFDTSSVQPNLEMEEFERYFQSVRLLKKYKPEAHTGYNTLKAFYEEKFSQ